MSWLRTHLFYCKLNAVMPELTVHTELLVYVGIYATDKGIKLYVRSNGKGGHNQGV